MKIAIYSRKSIETDKGESIKNQIKICKEYFLRHGNDIEFEVFEDEGFSGGNTNRPSFRMMLNRAKDKEFDIIACYKIDRIARNIVDFVTIYSELEKVGIKLVSVTEGFDPSTPLGKVIMMILASFAEMERANIQQRVKDNMRELAKSGKWTGGNVPFGFISERTEEHGKLSTYLKSDDKYIQIIKNIFNYYIKTQSMHQVQKWLYGNNIKMCMSSIKNILTSPIYVKSDKKIIDYLQNFGEVFGTADGEHGIITYNRRPYTNGKHRWNDKTMFYAISKHKGIIDPDVWLKTQNIQEKNKNTPRPKCSQITYLTSVLKCGKCGSNMTISYNHKNKDGSITYVYVCTGRKSYGNNYCNCKQIKQSLLDPKIETYLDNYLKLNKNEFFSLLKNDAFNINDDKLKKLEKKLSINNTKINNLVDKLSDLSNEEGTPFMKKIKNLTRENEEYKKELIYLKQEQLNNEAISPKEIYENFKMATAIIKNPNIDIGTKKAAIESCIKEIKCIKYDSKNIELHVEFL